MTTIQALICKALDVLISLKLNTSTIQCYHSSYFKPILDQYIKENKIYYDSDIMERLLTNYNKQYRRSMISRNTHNKRIRGVYILQELYESGTFDWKVFTPKEIVKIPSVFSDTISAYLATRKIVKHNIQFEKNILNRFVIFLMGSEIDNPSQLSANHTRDFIQHIAIDCPKSMDKIVTTISKYLKYLLNQTILKTDFTSIIIQPRSRDHHIHAAMKLDVLAVLLESIDKTTMAGKRDFAILSLASTTGLRAGDIVLLHLDNIDWKMQELTFIQGKTEQVLRLPLKKSVCNAIADYILNGRPQTDSNILFIRSLAPFVGFQDGTSVACILRRHLKKVGIEHIPTDGNTFHGIRRMIGTQMIVNSIPVTTISQVLGHQSIHPTKQYISLDIEGLKKCSLSMSTLGFHK